MLPAAVAEPALRQHVCRLDPVPLASAFTWLRFYEHFWNERLDALQALLDQALLDPDPAKDES